MRYLHYCDVQIPIKRLERRGEGEMGEGERRGKRAKEKKKEHKVERIRSYTSGLSRIGNVAT